MRTYIATITSRGQVTIPAEIRKVLGLHGRGKVIFEIDGDVIRLLPYREPAEPEPAVAAPVDDPGIRLTSMTYALESAADSVPALDIPMGYEEIKHEVLEEKAERVVRQLRGK